VTFRGVKTQLSGTPTGSTRALYTSPNPIAPGIGDVDGGTCEVRSPLLAVGPGDVTVGLNYYHGQLGGGTDASDGFAIDVVDDSGTLLDTIVSVGDVTTNASWTEASRTFLAPANTNLQLRVRATDGPAGDDLVEAGIDDVLVCANPPAAIQGCAVFENFEGGAPDFVNDASSTCDPTGLFVVGTPTGAGVQIDGSNQGLRSAFTGEFANVGGGVCVYGTNRAYPVTSDSTLSVAELASEPVQGAQGTAVDPDAEDFFALEYSVDGGSSWIELASNGDAAQTPTWTTATAQVLAGSNVALRVRCGDGIGGNDNVECGIDDFSVCSNAN